MKGSMLTYIIIGIVSIAGIGILISCNSKPKKEVAEKILRHSKALGGISRFSFQMDNAKLSHKQLMDSIELIGQKVSPIVNGTYDIPI